MKAYNIAVAGTGYVGLVAGVCFAHVGHRVTCVDVDEAKVARMRAGESPIYEEGLEELMRETIAAGRIRFTTDFQAAYREADAIFIGVGTPEQPDGSANLTHIATVARQIAESVEKDCLVVVKSTVPVGTNDKVEQFIHDFLAHDVRVEVASNPEFLAQGTAVRDTLEAQRIIIGTKSEAAERTMREIYEPFGLPIVSVGRRSAEMIKYASSDFLALKISYINDVANLCELVGAVITEVARGMSYDERIGKRFLIAGVGYGGSCFPKDTQALRFLARQCGYRLRTVDAAVEVNEAQKTVLFEKACRRLITFDHLKVAVLGVAFKAGTDDLREAPSIDNVQKLLDAGAIIHFFDPAAAAAFERRFPGRVFAERTPEDALSGANVCFAFTEWPEVRALAPEIFRRRMRTPLVYDGRNLFDPARMAAAGVEYYCVGRSGVAPAGRK